MKCIPALIAAAIGALASASAFSNSTASASIGPLTIRLVDLDLADGVTPWITFSGESTVGAAVSGPVGDDLPIPLFGNTPWVANNTYAGVAFTQANATIWGSGTVGTAEFGAAVVATSFIGAVTDEVSFAAQAGTQGARFNLSANTLVVISGSAVASAAMAGADDGALVVSAYLSVGGLGSLGNGQQSATDSIQLVRDQSPGGSDFLFDDRRTLSVSFVNLLNQSADGYFSVGAEARGALAASPVPEPETYALMLAGLAAIGMLARRRG